MTLRSYIGRVSLAAFVACLFIFTFFHDDASSSSLMPSLASLPRPGSTTTSSRLYSPRKFTSLRDRIQLSEFSWKRSVEQRHAMISAMPQSVVKPWPQKWTDEPGNLVMWDYFPASFSCPHDVQRVGRLGDGGKWVCGMSVYESIPVPPAWTTTFNIPSSGQDGVVVYSFGINGDSSFEAEFLERVPSARIWGFDFSVDGWGPQIGPLLAPRTFFKKAGIGAKDQPDLTTNGPLYTLQSLMAQNNHTYIDVLKIDVEGSEFKSLEAFMDHVRAVKAYAGILPIGQVMIEIHANEKYISFPNFRRWWERLEGMGMRATWIELNLLRVTLFQEPKPDCTEYVWVNARDEGSKLWYE
ncbi:hypothetical protein DM02DRAFT_674540 [Periconia macrospinosa]|uniref:Methyltransferase domain-containing protein n=1 Tax=Periconia macrospinosa TaxID=97972 RepID=A0A2V1DGR9_9PLEO|nr:hypothetical protein DM02DRAFT_674540 [Periconia macrospinosa]